jgi:ABC-type glycerol-3-phosphate transport system substrate-binding protein
MDSPAAVESLEWMANLASISPKAPVVSNDQRVGLGFNSVVSALQQTLPTMDWAFAEWPVGPHGKQGISSAGANYIAISPNSKHPEEAWRFIKFLSDKSTQQFEVFERGSNVILKSVAFSPRYLKLDKAPWDMTPVVMNATKPLPVFAKNWDSIEPKLINAVNEVLSNIKSAQTAMTELAEYANTMLAN